jgi:hypothetical protein
MLEAVQTQVQFLMFTQESEEQTQLETDRQQT